MKVTRSRDGLRRFDLNVKVRVDALMAATLITAYESPDDETPADFAARMLKLGKRKLVDTMRKEIERDGAETPFYRVNDSGLGKHSDALAAALKTVWEFD